MELREMLLRDFGTNLAIAGGFGQSAKDPIRITAKNPSEAALIQLQLARCIYMMNGWYWRAIQRIPVVTTRGRVEKLSSEVKYIERDLVITERRNLYFDISEVELQVDQQLPSTRVLIGYPAELGLPWQLGWYHFDGLINNEPTYPGLGVSVAYSAPQAKMTVYAYDKSVGDAIEANPEASAQAEYLQAISDFELMNPSAQAVREYEEASMRLKIYQLDNAFCAVILAPFRKFFFKVRLTSMKSNQPFTVDCAWSTIAAFGKTCLSTSGVAADQTGVI